MARVTEKLTGKGSGPMIVCDFSPPRGSGTAWLEDARSLHADFICVAYNPGRSVRLDSAITAYLIGKHCGKEVIFNLATRDMNKLAVQTHLLGANALGLENVVVMKGDDFEEQEAIETRAPTSFAPTALMAAIKAMGRGLDHKGRRLEGAIDFCVGGVVDLGKGVGPEARLARHKALAGADFLLTQPLYDVRLVERFLEKLRPGLGPDTEIPVFFGVEAPAKDGVVFGHMPESTRDELARGRSGQDIALEVISRLRELGLDNIYLFPPVMKGGTRDYETAQKVISSLR